MKKLKQQFLEVSDALALGNPARIAQSGHFEIEEKLVRDEYRYVEYELKYPQQFSQPPCLRPIIKLELIETISLHAIEERSIQSLVAELYHQPKEVSKFACVSIHSTLVEKILSMLRRTMLVKRDSERNDDAALVRHIYDVHCIGIKEKTTCETLVPLFHTILQEDIQRFGNQHAEFVADPANELNLGLQELESNPLFRQRFDDFVKPMVFDPQPHDFDTCFASFKQIAQSLIITI